MKKMTASARNTDQPVKANVHYLENGLPRQRQFTAADEEQLYQQVFLFEIETPHISVRLLSYRGKVVNWKPVYTGLHYCFGEGSITFEQFCEEFLSEPEVIAP